MKLILVYIVALCACLPVSLFGQYTMQNPPPAPPYVHPVPLDSGWTEITDLEEFNARCLDIMSIYNSSEDEEIARREQYGVIIRDSINYFKYRFYDNFDNYDNIPCNTMMYSVYFPHVDFNQHDLLFYVATCGGCDYPTVEKHFYVNDNKKEYLFFVQLGYWGDCPALRISHHNLRIPKLNPAYTVKFKRISKIRS